MQNDNRPPQNEVVGVKEYLGDAFSVLEGKLCLVATNDVRGKEQSSSHRT
jgi:hypothetical protein